MKILTLFALLISFLFFFSTETYARLERMYFVEEVRGAKYAVVAKPVKIELLWCGLNVQIQVIEDLKGNAPEFIDVGIVEHPDHPVVANHSSMYFMVITEGKVRYGYGGMVPAYKNKEEKEKAAKQQAECDLKLPDHKVNHWVMGEIKKTKPKWLKKPIYLAVPGHIESLVYYTKGTEIIRGTVKDIQDDNEASIAKKSFHRLDNPSGDPIPLGAEYGEYYNWDQLRQVWLDAENTCDQDHETYNEEACKLQNEDYRRQKNK